MSYVAQSVPSDRFRHLFETDVLTNFQFYNVYRQKAHLGPEERLAFAVLTDAIECFQRYCDAKGRKGRLLFRNAEAWIMGNDVRYPFSFVNICHTLNISPAYLRLGLIQWLANQQNDRCTRRRIRETLRYQNRVSRSHISN
jgi:hypothetical protein